MQHSVHLHYYHCCPYQRQLKVTHEARIEALMDGITVKGEHLGLKSHDEKTDDNKEF